MIPGKIFTSFATFQGVVSVKDLRLPIGLQELLQAPFGFLRSFRFARIQLEPLCGEGELVCGVHTLVWRSVQVYHELQELEEEEKGREEVQEIERESQVEENHSHGHDHGDDMK